MPTALFIGRFQPIHLGHLQVIHQAVRENSYLIIGIGSAEDNYQPQNPFTASERFQMIKAALDSEKIPAEKYTIIPIRNINQYSLWVSHVQELVPPFSRVYTGSPLVKQLFLDAARKDLTKGRDAGNYEVIDIKFQIDVNATEVRRRLLADSDWQDLLHPEVSKFLKKIKAPERMKAIHVSIPFH